MADKLNDEKVVDPAIQEALNNSSGNSKPQVNTGPNFRYADPACTGIAYYSETNNAAVHPVSVCKNCGATLGPVEKDRFIPLTQNEKEQLKASEK